MKSIKSLFVATVGYDHVDEAKHQISYLWAKIITGDQPSMGAPGMVAVQVTDLMEVNQEDGKVEGRDP